MVNPTCIDISFSFWKVSSTAYIVLVVSSKSSAWAEHSFMRVDMFPFRFSCFNTLSVTILNRVADRGSPCLTPETILNSFVNWLPIFTFAIELVRLMTIAFVFINSFFIQCLLTKTADVKNWHCCRKQHTKDYNTVRRYMTPYFMHLPWPPLKAGLSISTFCFLFKHARKLSFIFTSCLWQVDHRRNYPASSMSNYNL